MLTKSKYVEYQECITRAWLDINKKEERNDSSDTSRMEEGIKVGKLARDLFGDYTLIDEEDTSDALFKTKEALLRRDNIICEATFKFNDNLCKVDILKRNDDNTYSIYEVKAANDICEKSSAIKKKYLHDISFQYYVLLNTLVDVKEAYLVHMNKQYVYNGNLDIQKLFKIDNVTDHVKNEYKNVEETIKNISNIKSKTNVEILLKGACRDCPYKEYCFKEKHIPKKNSVIDLYDCKVKYKYANKGLLSFMDLRLNSVELSNFNQIMVDSRLDNIEEHKDISAIKNYLSQFEYPLYFFDFESYQEAIPTTINSRPYQQICFQYSLHILKADGTLDHKEYLATNYNEPRLDLIKQMINDLGEKGTIIAYYDTFEKTRIEEMARDFPKYAKELNGFLNRFVDLIIPFDQSMYYNIRMSKTSIKDVLPSMFPNDPTLDYHNLSDVHKGDEASKAFLDLKNGLANNPLQLRDSLLKYCCLDTYAMVKIFWYLKDLTA